MIMLGDTSASVRSRSFRSVNEGGECCLEMVPRQPGGLRISSCHRALCLERLLLLPIRILHGHAESPPEWRPAAMVLAGEGREHIETSERQERSHPTLPRQQAQLRYYVRPPSYTVDPPSFLRQTANGPKRPQW